jgi:hypothetical protein
VRSPLSRERDPSHCTGALSPQKVQLRPDHVYEFAIAFQSRSRCARLLRITGVEDAQFGGVGAEVDAGRPRAEEGIRLGAGRPIARGAVGGLEPDLAGAFELGSVRRSRSRAVPEVEDARRVVALLRAPDVLLRWS